MLYVYFCVTVHKGVTLWSCLMIFRHPSNPSVSRQKNLAVCTELCVLTVVICQGDQMQIYLQKRKPCNNECSECGKRFPSQWKLERHLVVHTGMRPFICPYCTKSHTQADNLKIHIKKVHPDCPLPSVEEMREMMYNAYNSPALYSALTHVSNVSQPRDQLAVTRDPLVDPHTVTIDN